MSDRKVFLHRGIQCDLCHKEPATYTVAESWESDKTLTAVMTVCDKCATRIRETEDNYVCDL